MSCYSKYSVTLPHGDVGWIAACVIVVFPDHTHLLFEMYWLGLEPLDQSSVGYI